VAETWTDRVNRVLALLEKLPSAKEGSDEKEFQRAVWSLCQQLKETDAGREGGQMVPTDSLM